MWARCMLLCSCCAVHCRLQARGMPAPIQNTALLQDEAAAAPHSGTLCSKHPFTAPLSGTHTGTLSGSNVRVAGCAQGEYTGSAGQKIGVHHCQRLEHMAALAVALSAPCCR